MTELSFVFVDCGDPFYRLATHEMVQSARRVMPDVKITQISDSKTPGHPIVDRVLQADVSVTRENVALFKGTFMAKHALQCEEPLILCDVDMIWQKNPIGLLGGRGVTLMRRNDIPCMPFNTGLILSNRDGKKFWEEYLNVLGSLDINDNGGWYCDQIAAAIVYNERNADTEEMDLILPAPTQRPDRRIDGYAVHFKGAAKVWMADYARMV